MHLNSMGNFLDEILVRLHPAGAVGAGRYRHLQRPLLRRPASARHRRLQAGVPRGRRIAFVGTLCHHLDVGGLVAGSYGSNAIEIFQEGLRIPPLKLIEGGKLNEAVRAMILQNVRQPDMLWGDLQSQLASLQIGAAERRAPGDASSARQRFERAAAAAARHVGGRRCAR